MTIKTTSVADYSVDAILNQSGERFQKYPDSCGRGLIARVTNKASEHSRSYVAKSDRDKKKGIKTKTSKTCFSDGLRICVKS